VTSTERGQSFAFRVADTLELHRPDRGKKDNLRLERVLDSVRFKKKWNGRVRT